MATTEGLLSKPPLMEPIEDTVIGSSGGGGGGNVDDEDDKTSHKDLPANVGGVGGLNEFNVIGQIVDEYEQRLKEQVALAKEDIVRALEEQIKVSFSSSFFC